MSKEKRFDLGAKGVNVVVSPLHLADGALTFGQNVQKSLLGEAGGIQKRFGLELFKDVGTASVLALMNVGIRPPLPIHPDTGEPIVPGDPMYVKVWKSASEATATATIETVTFDSEDFDVGNLHDAVTNTERLTVPPGGDGIYFFIATASWEGRNASGGRLGAYVYKNGTTSRVGIQEETPDKTTGDGNLGTTFSCVGFINLVAGDYLIMRVRNDSGGNLNLLGGGGVSDLTSFGMVRLYAL